MIATSNCNAAKDLVSLFANGERVSLPERLRRIEDRLSALEGSA